MRLGTDSGHLEKPQVDKGRRYDRPVLSLSVKVQQQAAKRVDAERSARGLRDLNRVGILFECAIAGSPRKLSRHTGDEGKCAHSHSQVRHVEHRAERQVHKQRACVRQVSQLARQSVRLRHGSQSQFSRLGPNESVTHAMSTLG